MSFISKEYYSRIPELLCPAQILCRIILLLLKLKTLSVIDNLEEDDNCFFYRYLPIVLANNGHVWAELMIFKYLNQVSPSWIFKDLLFEKSSSLNVLDLAYVLQSVF